MSRRELLTQDERARHFAVPVDEASLVKYYTLSAEDQELLLAKRGAHNSLGAAVQLGLLRHPGFGLRSDEVVAEALLRYLAGQLNVSAKAFRHYARRVQTRQEHAKELAGLLGLRPSARGDLPLMMRHATQAAQRGGRAGQARPGTRCRREGVLGRIFRHARVRLLFRYGDRTLGYRQDLVG
jgi:uncharacterized protein DUF4158